MGTAKVKQEEEADTRMITVRNMEKRNVGRKGGKSPKQGLINSQNLTTELPEYPP